MRFLHGNDSMLLLHYVSSFHLLINFSLSRNPHRPPDTQAITDLCHDLFPSMSLCPVRAGIQGATASLRCQKIPCVSLVLRCIGGLWFCLRPGCYRKPHFSSGLPSLSLLPSPLSLWPHSMHFLANFGMYPFCVGISLPMNVLLSVICRPLAFPHFALFHFCSPFGKP